MKNLALTMFAVVSLFFVAGPTSATEIRLEVRFSSDEVSIIRTYYEQQSVARKPDKKRRGQLPPGIAKNLGRGKPLPPGIAKRFLPGDLLGRLPPVPRGFERIVVDGKVLLVEIATQVIHDILTDIVFK